MKKQLGQFKRRQMGYDEYPCYRSVCTGIMIPTKTPELFCCDSCRCKAWRQEIEKHFAGEIDLEFGDTYEGVWGYDLAYDENGEIIKCPECGQNILEREEDKRLICPSCEHVMTEEELVNKEDLQ